MYKTTIVARKEGKSHKLIHTGIRKDGSIHVFFPRAQGWRIRSSKEVPFSSGYKTVTFDGNVNEKVFNPHVSYHPGKGVTHVNALNENGEEIHFIKDRSSVKPDLMEQEKSFSPIVTILLPPDLSLFDTVKETEIRNVLPLDFHESPNPKGLIVELFAHGKDGYIDPDSLQFKEFRKIVAIVPIEHSMETWLTYSLVLANVPNLGIRPNPEIVCFIWGKDEPFAFCLNGGVG